MAINFQSNNFSGAANVGAGSEDEAVRVNGRLGMAFSAIKTERIIGVQRTGRKMVMIITTMAAYWQAHCFHFFTSMLLVPRPPTLIAAAAAFYSYSAREN